MLHPRKTPTTTSRTSRAPSALASLAAALLLLALPLTAVAEPAAAAVGPLADARAAMDVTITEVLDVLKAPDLTSEARRQQIETIARERFDFETMSKLVLKRDWKRFSKEQRADFVREFTNYLAKNYGSRIDRYDQQSVEMLKDRLEANGDVTVLTEIRGGEADGIEVSYRMRDRNEAWRVIDVVIEGVSLISSFRSQFADVLSAGGPDEVLRRLTERNAQPAPAEESAPTA